MQLSQEALTEFKAIYQEEFGEDLSDEEALDAALRVLRFFMVMMTIERE